MGHTTWPLRCTSHNAVIVELSVTALWPAPLNILCPIWCLLMLACVVFVRGFGNVRIRIVSVLYCLPFVSCAFWLAFVK